MIDDSKEYIIASAVWYQDGKHYPFQSVYGISSGFVVCGFRHPLCLNLPLEKNFNDERICPSEQGFITSQGRFVGRKEAYLIAEECGQIPTTENKRSLFSEDVFPKQKNYAKI